MLAENVVLLPSTTITTALTGVAQTASTHPLGWARSVILEAVFDYGSGGTTVTAYVQTSLDGTHWTDIAAFSFTTSDSRKVAAVTLDDTDGTAPAAANDGALTSDTVQNGILGNLYRVKLTTTGTYGGNTTLALRGLFKG
jgi:hypothetical protein